MRQRAAAVIEHEQRGKKRMAPATRWLMLQFNDCQPVVDSCPFDRSHLQSSFDIDIYRTVTHKK